MLVNEVGAVDIDSQLVNVQRNNAALGVPLVPLSGGCACCTVNGDLQGAIKTLLRDTGQQYDYLVSLSTNIMYRLFHMESICAYRRYHWDIVMTSL